MKWFGVFVSFVSILCLVFSVTGCATRKPDREEILSRLLADIDNDSPSESVRSLDHRSDIAESDYRGSDDPDAPAAGLPPLNKISHIAPSSDIAHSGEGLDAIAEWHIARKVSSSLTIQPDSIVQITVSEDPSLDGSYPVNDIGAVDFDYIGPVILLNKSESEAAAKISEVLVARAFRKATVTVKILRASYDKVRISGAVANPGLIRIGAGDSISLNNALLRAGGIQASAKGAKIRIIRDGLLSAVGNELAGEEYSLVNAEGKPAVPDVMLDNNDVARVFSSEVKASAVGGDKEILVIGEVTRPGVYRFSGSEPCTIMHLIFKMGGLPPYAKQKAIIIKRVDEDGVETDIEVDAEKILKEGNPDDDMSLENGDRVIVPARRLSLF